MVYFFLWPLFINLFHLILFYIIQFLYVQEIDQGLQKNLIAAVLKVVYRGKIGKIEAIFSSKKQVMLLCVVWKWKYRRQ